MYTYNSFCGLDMFPKSWPCSKKKYKGSYKAGAKMHCESVSFGVYRNDHILIQTYFGVIPLSTIILAGGSALNGLTEVGFKIGCLFGSLL